MKSSKADQIRQAVRDHYGKVATGDSCGCCSSGDSKSGCCSPGPQVIETIGEKIGYNSADLAGVVEGANMNLGCGNPLAIAQLKPGETVLDLGSGGGFDSFLAAKAVGADGYVIGVDMTPEMVAKARANNRKMNLDNVSFRLGEIEYLPVADSRVDVILSNCVINLSPDKLRIWQEAYRVLRPGGRLQVSDVVAIKTMPEALQEELAFLTGCVSGAEQVETLREQILSCGFTNVTVTIKPGSKDLIGQWFPGTRVEEYVASADIVAHKPLE